MDISKLSDADLAALEAGDMTALSDEGLALLEGAAPAEEEQAPPPIDPATQTDPLKATVGAAGLAGAATVAGRAGAAVVRPWREKGRERIALRAVEKFAGGREELDAAMQRLRDTSQRFTLAKPTISQAGHNAGIAQLERNLRNHVDAMPVFTGADTRFADAIGGAIGSVAGTEEELQRAMRDRDKAARRLYKAAYKKRVDKDKLPPGEAESLEELFGRPAIAEAQKGAVTDFLNRGETPDPANAIQMMHGAKVNLDGQIGAAVRAGDTTKAASLMAAKKDLLDQIERLSRPYRRARKTYREMSRPIAQMEVGKELHNKLFPALADFGAIATMRPGMFAEALRNGDRTAQRATDFDGATLENTLRPEQLDNLNEVGRLLALRSNQQNLGRAVGSNTAQNLVGDDMMRALLGPLSRVEGINTGGKTLLKPLTWLYDEPEKLVKQETARMLTDSDYLQQAYERQRNTPTAKVGRAGRAAVSKITRRPAGKAGALAALMALASRLSGGASEEEVQAEGEQ